MLDATLSNMVSEPEPVPLDLQITKLSNQLMRPENVWLVRDRFLNLKLKNWPHLLDCIIKLVSDVLLATLVWLLQIMQENSMVQFIASSAMTGNSLHFAFSTLFWDFSLNFGWVYHKPLKWFTDMYTKRVLDSSCQLPGSFPQIL